MNIVLNSSGHIYIYTHTQTDYLRFALHNVRHQTYQDISPTFKKLTDAFSTFKKLTVQCWRGGVS